MLFLSARPNLSLVDALIRLDLLTPHLLLPAEKTVSLPPTWNTDRVSLLQRRVYFPYQDQSFNRLLGVGNLSTYLVYGWFNRRKMPSAACFPAIVILGHAPDPKFVQSLWSGSGLVDATPLEIATLLHPERLKQESGGSRLSEPRQLKARINSSATRSVS